MPYPPPIQIALGALFATLVAFGGYKARALTSSGAAAAAIVGTVVFGIGGWAWAIPMLVFFATSTLLSRWRSAAKSELGYEKGGRRDAGQVVANGWVAAACVMAFWLDPDTLGPHSYALYLACLAAANGDTWATEIGSAMGGRPISLATFKRVPVGTSGAVSVAGLVGLIAGAAAISAMAFVFHPPLYLGAAPDEGVQYVSFLTPCLAGVAGALLDSLLGATVQAQWTDPANSDRTTEKRVRGERPVRGLSVINNDIVNFACTAAAAAVAWGLR
jgi:uncharacterized protein (TIGR00297 family)